MAGWRTGLRAGRAGACALALLVAAGAAWASAPWRTEAGSGDYAVRFNYSGKEWWRADVQAIAVATRKPIVVLPQQYTTNGRQPGAQLDGRAVGRLWNEVTQAELARRLQGLGFHVLTPSIQMYGETLDGFQGLEHFIAGVARGNRGVQVLLLTADAHDPKAQNPLPGAQMLVAGTQPRAPDWEARMQRRIAPFYVRTGLGNRGPRVRGGGSDVEGSSAAWHPLIERAAEFTPYVSIMEVARAIDVQRGAGSMEAGREWAAELFDAAAWALADQACVLGFALRHCDAPGEAPERRYTAAEAAALQAAGFVSQIAASAGQRERRDQEMAAVRLALAAPPGAEPLPQLPALLGAIGLFNAELDAGRTHLLAALPRLHTLRPDDQHALLSIAHGLYAADVAPRLRAVLPRLHTPREFAAAAYVMLAAEGRADTRAFVAAQLAQRFAGLGDEPRLRALGEALNPSKRPPPPLADLLAAPFTPGLPVLFSVQRPGRQHRGLALVRGVDGRFLRRADGSLLAVPQLALARSNLPGTLTNGNTPQGLFTVVGIGTADNPWIGPTPYLHTKLPVEAGVAEFVHGVADPAWTEAHYEALLPPAWRTYAPFKEAWLAGRAGRSEILAHGTTIAPAYYRGDSFAPGTPSAGCLVASEDWGDDGRLRHSDQLALVQAFAATGHDRGFMVVVETAPRAEPVSAAELQAAVEAAEADRARRPSTAELRGTWLTTTGNDAISSPAHSARTMQRLRETGLNTVYVEVWKNGYTQFPSQVLQATVGVDRRPALALQDPGDAANVPDAPDVPDVPDVPPAPGRRATCCRKH